MDKNYFNTENIKGDHARVMAADVAKALTMFCEQEPEFEQAIDQSGRTYQECLDHVAKGVGKSISDLEAYKKAVQFYFAGADVHFHMTIDLCGSVGAAPPITMTTTKTSALSVSLDELLGDL